LCKWEWKAWEHIEVYDGLFDVCCPNCDEMLLIVNFVGYDENGKKIS
jgi:hypothetical protein